MKQISDEISDGLIRSNVSTTTPRVRQKKENIPKCHTNTAIRAVSVCLGFITLVSGSLGQSDQHPSCSQVPHPRLNLIGSTNCKHTFLPGNSLLFFPCEMFII